MSSISQVFLAIDDTDNKDSKGTGHLLEGIRHILAEKGIQTQAISRHQLYVHDDVPYTSHNSSMCTEMDVDRAFIPELIALAAGYLVEHSAEGSDPGLCVACIDDLTEIAELISYARRCKNSLMTKDEAYGLAVKLGVHLSEHGGTGQGVVGALAAVGLRLFGFDGRVKGHIKMGENGASVTVAELQNTAGIHAVMAINGADIDDSDKVTLTEGRLKAVRMNWQSTVVVAPAEDKSGYATLAKQMLRVY